MTRKTISAKTTARIIAIISRLIYHISMFYATAHSALDKKDILCDSIDTPSPAL